MGKQYEIVYANGEMYKCNDHYPDTYALNIEWDANGIGFGELNITYNKRRANGGKTPSICRTSFAKRFLRSGLQIWKGVEDDTL